MQLFLRKFFRVRTAWFRGKQGGNSLSSEHSDCPFHFFRSLAVALAALVLAAALPAQSAELSPAIQADRHLMQAERQIGDGDYAAALASLDGILALQAEHDLAIPDAFWFKHGQVSQEAGLHAQAVESVTRYLVTAGQGGEHYLAALELLDVAEAEAAGSGGCGARGKGGRGAQGSGGSGGCTR